MVFGQSRAQEPAQRPRLEKCCINQRTLSRGIHSKAVWAPIQISIFYYFLGVQNPSWRGAAHQTLHIFGRLCPPQTPRSTIRTTSAQVIKSFSPPQCSFERAWSRSPGVVYVQRKLGPMRSFLPGRSHAISKGRFVTRGIPVLSNDGARVHTDPFFLRGPGMVPGVRYSLG